jgi:CBS domain containing-hemolysin-like protein
LSQNALLLTLAAAMVLLAAVFVATETALARVSKATIDQLRKDGSKRASRLSELLDDRAKYVNSLLFAH